MTRQQVRRPLASCLSVLVLVLFPASVARAVTDEEVFRDLRFDFLNPGARAVGMGGAFVAVADDATAAVANPAGLGLISAPQLFVELNSINNDARIFESNFGDLAVDTTTGERDLPFLRLTSVSETDTVTEPSFVSFAWPMKLGRTGRRLTVAGSRQVVLSEDRSLATGGMQTEVRTAFDTFPNTVNNGQIEAYSVAGPVSGKSSTEIVYWNAGASLELHQDFSVGFMLTFATLDIQTNTLTQIDDPLQLFLDPSHPRLSSQPSTELFETVIDDTDEGFGWNFGIHWHPDSVFASGKSPWAFGAVFRKGAEFQFAESTFSNGVQDVFLTTALNVPDRYSVGASYRAGTTWLFSLEVERIEYSDLLQDFQRGINFLTSDRMDGFFGVDPDRSVRFDVDDGTVPRVGAEYAHALGRSGRQLSFSAGYFRTADDRIRMVEFHSVDQGVNDVYLDAFRGAEEENHFTAGFGLTIGRSVIQVAGDFSDVGTQVVGSYTFSVGQQ